MENVRPLSTLILLDTKDIIFKEQLIYVMPARKPRYPIVKRCFVYIFTLRQFGMILDQYLKINSAIARELFNKVFGLYILLAIFITLFQIFDEYRNTKHAVNLEINKIFESFEPSLQAGLWSYNPKLINSIAQGMNRLKLVNGIKVLDNNGSVIYFKQDKETPERTWLSQPIKHSYKVTHQAHSKKEPINIGHVIILSETRNIFDRVKYGIFLTAISSILKTLSLWLIFSYYIKKYLSDPVTSLSEQVENIDFEKNNKTGITLPNNNKNELGILKNSFNKMLGKLSEYSRKIEVSNKELSEFNNHLELRVKKRTWELEESIKQLSESKKMNAISTLAIGMAHNINTPLGIIITSNSFLTERLESIRRSVKENTIKKSEFLDTISEIQNATSLISSSTFKIKKDVSKFKLIKASELEKTNTNIEKEINDIIEFYKDELGKLNITITINIMTNKHQNLAPNTLTHILSTLIENSIKHAFTDKSSGKINLTITTTNENLNLVFSDNGEFNSKMSIDNIFDPFYTSNMGVNSGLGLYIIYNYITDSLKGSITCKNNTGLTFDITIPLSSDKNNNIA